MLQVNIHQAKTNLSKLIQKVVDGEELIIAKRNQPIVKLILVDQIKPKRRLGSAKGLIKLTHDFDEPWDDFKEYMS
ncbi:type II toxin-antitoxin system Phd/YefM family antitoxin [candidate division KSB1 bacterium]|nr:type II toxin-antitoxin system Phd/YefM family antitoxin [candidate division KSB1 bacterium]